MLPDRTKNSATSGVHPSIESFLKNIIKDTWVKITKEELASQNSMEHLNNELQASHWTCVVGQISSITLWNLQFSGKKKITSHSVIL